MAILGRTKFKNCLTFFCVSMGRYTTKSAGVLSFLTSKPEGEKNVSKNVYCGYFTFSCFNTGSPCSYSPKEATCIQMTSSESENAFSSKGKVFFLPFTKNLILGLNLAIRRRSSQVNWTKKEYIALTNRFCAKLHFLGKTKFNLAYFLILPDNPMVWKKYKWLIFKVNLKPSKSR